MDEEQARLWRGIFAGMLLSFPIWMFLILVYLWLT